MATSSISECNTGLMRNNTWKQPLRPATTSPSFFPCRSLNSHLNHVPTKKTRYQLDRQMLGRDYFSLPSTPPQPDGSIIKNVELKEERMRNIQREGKVVSRDQNGNRFLPEWYVEPCAVFMNLPCSQEKMTPTAEAEPLDHPQKRETYLLDSSYDEDCDFSDKSQCLDFDNCSIVNPSSGEVSKLNSLGQGQSRLMSLFSSLGNNSSCSSSPISGEDEQDSERYIPSVAANALSESCLQDSEMINGIEAVRKGLARLLSIPIESTSLDQQLSCECTDEEIPEQEPSTRTNSGSRLIKLFPPSVPNFEKENDWEQGSLLGINTLWRSESSLGNGQSCTSSQTSSMKNSPTALSPEKEVFPLNSVKVPNITSISPTAPLHFSANTSHQVFEGFPNPNKLVSNAAVNTSFYTACDLSNEETEIEAALERGDGFFKDEVLCIETEQPNDAIWSPSVASACSNHHDDDLNSDSYDQRAFKEFAESAANDIMDWLDIWLSQCAESTFHGRLTENWSTNCMTPNFEEEKTQEGSEGQHETKAMDLYAMFDVAATDGAWQRIMSLGDDDAPADQEYQKHDMYAHLTQSPGILDLLVERDNQERDLESETQFPGNSLHFMLNSRASDIYDSYLLFPDLMQFSHPLKSMDASNYRELDESSLFSHLFSSSFDWMGSLNVLDPEHHNIWDHTLQSLSPKTPFTPTGNLNDNLHSFEKKHSITLEQLCNLASVASSMESVGLDHSSILSTDFLVQYLQSQLGCFENIALFNSPSLKKELIEESSRNFNEDSDKLYRPIPLFPLQFVNRLSLTNSDNIQDKSLLVSPTTHFRPITPKPEGIGDKASCDHESSNDERKPKVETIPDDIDEELVAIHEGADHAKLVKIYAQMQLKQQLAAEQKQNYPQLEAVGEDGYMEEENAYEDKHVPPSEYEQDVDGHALDCAAEAAATAAVNALGSAEPAEALALLEEWHWKEAANEERMLAKTFPDLGYFETAQDFHPSNSNSTSQSHLFLADSTCAASTTWSVDDGSSIDQNFKYDSLKQIWIKTDSAAEEKSSHASIQEQHHSNSSFFLDQSLFMGIKGNVNCKEIGLSPMPKSSIPLSFDECPSQSDRDEDDDDNNDDGIGDLLESPSIAPFEDISMKHFTQRGLHPETKRKELYREIYSSPTIPSEHQNNEINQSSYLGNTEDDSSWDIWLNKGDEDGDGEIHLKDEPTLFDQRNIALQEDCGTPSSEKEYLFGYLKFHGKDQSLVYPR